MSKPINQQKQLIEKYFYLLVKEFITDPRHNKDISIVYQDYIKSSKKNYTTLGQTLQRGGGEEWQVWPNGERVPGSTVYHPYRYVITFLNRYKDEEELRGCVVHEFTHLYLYAIIGGKHDHDDRFYSTMEWLESWLNKNQGLSPRVDKSHDRDQYEDNHSDTANDKESTCPKCFYPNPHHSPQCSQNQNKPYPTNQFKPGQKPDITNDAPKLAELDLLKNLLEASRDLATLESVYQNIKTNPYYHGENCNDNKKTLDNLYQRKKYNLQSSNNRRFSTNGSNYSNENGLGSREYFLIGLAAVGIIFTLVILYLLISENQSHPKKKR